MQKKQIYKISSLLFTVSILGFSSAATAGLRDQGMEPSVEINFDALNKFRKVEQPVALPTPAVTATPMMAAPERQPGAPIVVPQVATEEPQPKTAKKSSKYAKSSSKHAPKWAETPLSMQGKTAVAASESPSGQSEKHITRKKTKLAKKKTKHKTEIANKKPAGSTLEIVPEPVAPQEAKAPVAAAPAPDYAAMAPAPLATPSKTTTNNVSAGTTSVTAATAPRTPAATPAAPSPAAPQVATTVITTTTAPAAAPQNPPASEKPVATLAETPAPAKPAEIASTPAVAPAPAPRRGIGDKIKNFFSDKKTETKISAAPVAPAASTPAPATAMVTTTTTTEIKPIAPAMPPAVTPEPASKPMETATAEKPSALAIPPSLEKTNAPASSGAPQATVPGIKKRTDMPSSLTEKAPGIAAPTPQVSVVTNGQSAEVATVNPPQPAAQLDKSTLSARGLLARVEYSSNGTDVPSTAVPGLDQVADQMKASPDQRLTIVSYSTTADGQSSSARRTSLKRALSVRKYLMDKGVDGARINVQAMGDSTTEPPLDRVDISRTGNS